VIALGETYEIEKWTFIISPWLVVVILLCLTVVVFSIVHDQRKKKLKKAGR
jgi:cbb3-type cytochrome oxidase subunit 3